MYTAFKRYDTEGPFKPRQETGEFLVSNQTCTQPVRFISHKRK